MNKVVLKSKNNKPKYNPGTYWQCTEPDREGCYLLVYTVNYDGYYEYNAINIANGYSWNGSHQEPKYAIDGLKYLGDSLTITIS